MTENELKINGKSFGETISQIEEYMESDDVHGELFTILRSARDFMENLNEQIQQYRAIGTVDEFKALKEKSTPMKPIPNIPPEEGEVVCWTCPSCKKKHWNGYYFPPLTFDKVCTNCLQAIDWD